MGYFTPSSSTHPTAPPFFNNSTNCERQNSAINFHQCNYILQEPTKVLNQVLNRNSYIICTRQLSTCTKGEGSIPKAKKLANQKSILRADFYSNHAQLVKVINSGDALHAALMLFQSES